MEKKVGVPASVVHIGANSEASNKSRSIFRVAIPAVTSIVISTELLLTSCVTAINQNTETPPPAIIPRINAMSKRTFRAN